MELQEHLQVPTVNREGICATCENLAVCGYHAKHLHPIAFCEEFASGLNPPDTAEDETGIDPWRVPIDSIAGMERNAKAYMGLCSSCERLHVCRFLKPGGGTFRCELFIEKKH